MNPTIADGLHRLRAAGLTQRAVGCSLDEIAQVEMELRATLPATYREFLLALGSSGGAFLQGSDFAWSQLARINREARELVRSAGARLPPSAFVFLMHQGYQFLFFAVSEGRDPQVLRFEEGGSIQPVGMAFSEWFLSAADDEIRAWRNVRR